MKRKVQKKIERKKWEDRTEYGMDGRMNGQDGEREEGIDKVSMRVGRVSEWVDRGWVS